MDLWPVTVEERRSLLATFEQLDGDQWDVPSLSEQWSVRQVLAHLILAARPPLKRYVVAAAKARGSFDTANHVLAVEDARRPVTELLADYRAVIPHRFSPPGWPAAAPLSDILLHSLDVRIPLGLPTERPPQHYAPVMDLLFSRAGRSVAPKGRPLVRWVATDHAWSHGDGEEVRGAIADLALTASGRSAHLDQLEGPGAAALRTWLR
jgi:uncharacterized protein (TIGR03083 family)